MVAFPSGWRRAFPDQELVVVDMLAAPAKRLSPPAYVCTWLPEPDVVDQMLADGQAIVRAARLPGGSVSPGGVLDTGVIQLAVFAPRRDDAWGVLDYVEQVLMEYADGGEVTHDDGSVSLVTGVGYDSSPLEREDINVDERLAFRSYELTCRKTR